MTRFILLAAALSVAAVPRAADRPKVSPRADALDLVLLGEKPVRVELRIEIDGKSVPEVWDETFAKLLAFHDRDGDGSLDKAEAVRLPSAFALRGVLWGQFTPVTGDAPPFADLDLDADGRVSGDELADGYRRAGLGGVLVGVGKPPSTDRLTDAILKALDANKDGKVEEKEWKGAADALGKLDANGDELVGPGELVDKVAYPGALGSVLLTAPFPGAKPDATTDALPLVVLPLRTADTHWTTKLPRDVRTAKPAAGWQAKFGAKPPADTRLMHAAGPVRFELRTAEGKLAVQTAAARKRFEALYAECDADADGTLGAKELAAPKAGPLKQLAAAADRDADGALGGKEFAAWLDLQEQVAKGHVLLTVLDHGAGLFEVLDADRDGALSVRELRAAWDRAGNGFDRAKLPRHLLATVSRGHPVSALGKPARPGPDWFRAMDRNGDGDVSRKEFTGPADVFERYDADTDGLLDANEALRG